MTQYSGMSFSLWECMSAREREERVWLYKILNNDLGKKCSFPFGQWPKVICIGLCDFPRRMWGPAPHSDSNPLLWSVCWVWSWPWPQLQRTFLSCTGEGRVGYAEKTGQWVCVGGGRSIRLLHLQLIRSSLRQTSPQQWCTKLQRERATVGVESCGLLESSFPLWQTR